jgi:hypothetical protein
MLGSTGVQAWSSGGRQVGAPQFLDNQRKDPRGEEHGDVAEFRHVNDPLVVGEDAGDDEVVRAADDRTESNPRSTGVRSLQTPEEFRVRPELASHEGPEPVGVVRAVVGRAQRDATVHPAGAPELLQVGACHETAEAVANEIDAPPSNVATKVVPQVPGGSFDALARPVVERQNLLEAHDSKVACQRKQ